MKNIIEVKNIGKKYKITHQKDGYLTFRDTLVGIAKMPLRIFGENKAEEKEDFWALRDVSFKIKKGEAVGIIGANGAGKSTLLKILSQITPPTEGEIKMKGRVASLLEVGTGFHPELTGRENIFLNGAILGMSKKEITEKFDEIVEFSGVEKFLDTPVKRYSSGMKVRLAFSVAAHLEPEILIVDEVLAVGDAEFQKKCLGKMDEVAKKTGRTILFVSHNMAAIRNLCERSVYLKNGKVEKIGETEDVIKDYIENRKFDSEVDLKNKIKSPGDLNYSINKIISDKKENNFIFCWDEPISLKIFIHIEKPVNNLSFGVGCVSVEGVSVFTVRDSDFNEKLFSFREKGDYVLDVVVNHNLRAGFYDLALGIEKGGISSFFNSSAVKIEISSVGGTRDYPYRNHGVVNIESKWKKSKIN